MYDSILPGNTSIYSHLGTGQSITITNAAGPPSFTMTGPTTGAFTAGQLVTINWTAGSVADSTTTITLGYDTATDWSAAKLIEAYQVQAANGAKSYVWNTTGIATGTYYLCGMMYDSILPANTSIYSHLGTGQSITITNAAGPPSFTMTGPTTGTFTAGQLVTINWTAGSVADSTTTITLGYDTATDWSAAKLIEAYQVQAANGAKSYLWNTTGIATGTYYLCGMMYDSVLPAEHLDLLPPRHRPIDHDYQCRRPAQFHHDRPDDGCVYRRPARDYQLDRRGHRRQHHHHHPGVRYGHQLERRETHRSLSGPGRQRRQSYVWNTTGITAGTYYLCGMMYDSALPPSTSIYSHLGAGQSIVIVG